MVRPGDLTKQLLDNEGINRHSVPKWLDNLSKHDIKNEELPINDLLKDSFYYPASGLDGGSFVAFSHYVSSFIHVDYGIAAKDMESNSGFLTDAG